MSELDTKFKELVRKRSGIKSRITAALKNLNGLDSDSLTEEIFKSRRDDVLTYLARVDAVNDEIIELFDKGDFTESDDNRVKEMDAQVAYRVQVTDSIAKLATTLNKKKDPPKHLKDKVMGVKMPELQCKIFSGKSTDKLEFKNFLQQFHNCVDGCESLTDAGKLTYLRGFLTDYAFRVISSLSVTDENYQVALKMLKDEFLDEEFIIDEIFKQLLNSYPKFDTTFNQSRIYINDIRAFLFEIKTYGVDLLDENTAGCKLISHIIFSKLPTSIKRELVHRVGTNYPTVVDLFNHYNDVIKTLLRTSNVSRNKDGREFQNKYKNKSDWRENKCSNVKQAEGNFKPSTLENFKTSVDVNVDSGRFCKFCSIQGHSMVSCNTYNTLDARRKRCKELKLCFFCTSNKHLSDKCPGKNNMISFPCFFCKSKAHISALCPKPKEEKTSLNTNLCINMGASSHYQPFLLPIISLNFQRGGNSYNVRCLLDDGSQRSYISQEVMDILKCDTYNWTNLNYDVKTFLGSNKRVFKECVMGVSIPGYKSLPLPVLIDNEFHSVYVSRICLWQ